MFENPELMLMMMRTLRADFEIAETYPRFSGPPLDCPITAFGGQDDGLVPREALEHGKSRLRGLLTPGSCPEIISFYTRVTQSYCGFCLSRSGRYSVKLVNVLILNLEGTMKRLKLLLLLCGWLG